MDKKLVIYKLILLILLVSLTGCIDFSGSDVKEDNINDIKTVVWTAKENNNDIPLDKNWEDGYSILYNSLNEGDVLIIRDIIDDIYYNKDSDETEVIFEWDEENNTDQLELFFQGDLTRELLIDDRVEVTLKIEYVKFTYEGFELEMEIFKGQWESEQYFKSDVENNGDGFKPLPADSIKVVYE